MENSLAFSETQNSTKQTYSSADLTQFRNLILKKIKQAQKTIDIHQALSVEGGENGTSDTAHHDRKYDEGSERSCKSVNGIIVDREIKHLRDLRLALLRIQNRNYGMCRITHNLIPKERLLLVPHATLSVEGKNIESSRRGRYHR